MSLSFDGFPHKEMHVHESIVLKKIVETMTKHQNGK